MRGSHGHTQSDSNLGGVGSDSALFLFALTASRAILPPHPVPGPRGCRSPAHPPARNRGR
ncbi:hypothetical protein E2C01_043170 [Portunus trituberculatus]|uniref:Uncharacterized protein n=1 Tax=Portunus trituberculatus TaxID=210409 RepID=A0A5B7FPK0_PORTR|nr:hypothetical protein [Portunus trituberculatus]